MSFFITVGIHKSRSHLYFKYNLKFIRCFLYVNTSLFCQSISQFLYSYIHTLFVIWFRITYRCILTGCLYFVVHLKFHAFFFLLCSINVHVWLFHPFLFPLLVSVFFSASADWIPMILYCRLGWLISRLYVVVVLHLHQLSLSVYAVLSSRVTQSG